MNQTFFYFINWINVVLDDTHKVTNVLEQCVNTA